METIEVNGKQYEVTGYAEDGLPIIRGVAETIEEGVDEDGNPIRSVRVEVPAINVDLSPGEVE